jgi:hypothetical protein
MPRRRITVVGANLCARDPLEVKGKGIRGVGRVADKEAYTVTQFGPGDSKYDVSFRKQGKLVED